MDHILPQVAGGGNEPENIAACYRCNEFKGAKTYTTDQATSSLVILFNPRTQSWANEGTHIVRFNSNRSSNCDYSEAQQ